MNSVKITYIICSLLGDIMMLGLAVAAPIYLTPGYYWWTAFGVLMILFGSHGFSRRLDSWGDFGNITDEEK